MLEAGHRLFTCSDEDRFAGVGILVNCKLVDKVKAFHGVNGRLCGIDMIFGNLKFRILAVYMPTQRYDISVIEENYGRMGLLLREGRRHGMRIIIGGDFNTDVS